MNIIGTTVIRIYPNIRTVSFSYLVSRACQGSPFVLWLSCLSGSVLCLPLYATIYPHAFLILYRVWSLSRLVCSGQCPIQRSARGSFTTSTRNIVVTFTSAGVATLTNLTLATIRDNISSRVSYLGERVVVNVDGVFRTVCYSKPNKRYSISTVPYVHRVGPGQPSAKVDFRMCAALHNARPVSAVSNLQHFSSFQRWFILLNSKIYSRTAFVRGLCSKQQLNTIAMYGNNAHGGLSHCRLYLAQPLIKLHAAIALLSPRGGSVLSELTPKMRHIFVISFGTLSQKQKDSTTGVV